ncbi:MAG: hypothetical protein ACK55Z_06880 [bacterium]
MSSFPNLVVEVLILKKALDVPASPTNFYWESGINDLRSVQAASL